MSSQSFTVIPGTDRFSKRQVINHTIEQQISPLDGHNIFEWHKHLTDAGNAERFGYFARNEARYCEPWGRWLLYDGQRWKVDDQNEITVKIRNVNRRLYGELQFMTDDRRRSEIAAHLARSESKAAINACEYLARGEIPVVPDQLDRDPWLLNTPSGTLDVRTGELRDHDPDDLITKITGAACDPSANCPVWKSFLHQIFRGNVSLITFVQKYVGYALTGDISEQCFEVDTGNGSNGKTTKNNAIEKMLGDYAQPCDIQSFLVRKNESISNDIARLNGARFVSASESDQGKKLSEPLIKRLTGGERITTRFLYGENFDFTPTFKIVLSTNHKPRISGSDYAIWRRIRVVPFKVTIPPEEQDKDLPAKLDAELDGILNWAIEGCKKWQEEGLACPMKCSKQPKSTRPRWIR